MEEWLHVDLEFGLRLLLSFVIGTAIGLEREYRSKAAGLRTMIMICLGSTIFTEVSMAIGGSSPDRIASNIITGIGFLGAGVIFKDGLSISGITTATTIWISAALGMAVGAGEYFIALVGLVVILIVLTVFEKIQVLIERFHQERVYKITYLPNGTFQAELEQELQSLRLGFHKKRDMKDDQHIVILYDIAGREQHFELLHVFLKGHQEVKRYEY